MAHIWCSSSGKDALRGADGETWTTSRYVPQAKVRFRWVVCLAVTRLAFAVGDA